MTSEKDKIIGHVATFPVVTEKMKYDEGYCPECKRYHSYTICVKKAIAAQSAKHEAEIEAIHKMNQALVSAIKEEHEAEKRAMLNDDIFFEFARCEQCGMKANFCKCSIGHPVLMLADWQAFKRKWIGGDGK